MTAAELNRLAPIQRRQTTEAGFPDFSPGDPWLRGVALIVPRIFKPLGKPRGGLQRRTKDTRPGTATTRRNGRDQQPLGQGLSSWVWEGSTGSPREMRLANAHRCMEP